MHRMQLTLLLERGNLDESSFAPHPGADYRELSQLSAFQTETLFGGWPASLGDMVRFLAQAGLSCNAPNVEANLVFCPRPGTQVLVTSLPPPFPPPPLALGLGVMSPAHRPPPLPRCSSAANKQILALVRETRCAYRQTLKSDMPFCPFCRASPDCPGPPAPGSG